MISSGFNWKQAEWSVSEIHGHIGNYNINLNHMQNLDIVVNIYDVSIEGVFYGISISLNL